MLSGLFFEDIFYILISELGLERAYGYVWKQCCVSSPQKHLKQLQLILFFLSHIVMHMLSFCRLTFIVKFEII